MNNNRRRGFRPRQQKNGFRRRNGSSDHSGQIYNISSNKNFKRNIHNPVHLEKTISKYHQLAKDAQSLGDYVLSENYLQHADHFARMLPVQVDTNHSSQTELKDLEDKSLGDENKDIEINKPEAKDKKIVLL